MEFNTSCSWGLPLIYFFFFVSYGPKWNNSTDQCNTETFPETGAWLGRKSPLQYITASIIGKICQRETGPLSWIILLAGHERQWSKQGTENLDWGAIVQAKGPDTNISLIYGRPTILQPCLKLFFEATGCHGTPCQVNFCLTVIRTEWMNHPCHRIFTN